MSPHIWAPSSPGRLPFHDTAHSLLEPSCMVLCAPLEFLQKPLLPQLLDSPTRQGTPTGQRPFSSILNPWPLIRGRHTVNICEMDLHDIIGRTNSQVIQTALKTQRASSEASSLDITVGGMWRTGFQPHKGHEADGHTASGRSEESPTALLMGCDFLCRHTAFTLLGGGGGAPGLK